MVDEIRRRTYNADDEGMGKYMLYGGTAYDLETGKAAFSCPNMTYYAGNSSGMKITFRYKNYMYSTGSGSGYNYFLKGLSNSLSIGDNISNITSSTWYFQGDEWYENNYDALTIREYGTGELLLSSKLGGAIDVATGDIYCIVTENIKSYSSEPRYLSYKIYKIDISGTILSLSYTLSGGLFVGNLTYYGLIYGKKWYGWTTNNFGYIDMINKSYIEVYKSNSTTDYSNVGGCAPF